MIVILTFLTGLYAGRLANILIGRLERANAARADHLFPLSCASCGRPPSPRDRIPVLGWLLSRGKCRWCHERVNPRYPAIEAACSGLFAGMAIYADSGLSVVPLCALAFVLLCVSCLDIAIWEIPDSLLLFGFITGALWVIASYSFALNAPALNDALLGALAGAAPLFVINRLTILLIKKDGFGYGDMKLMAMAGLFLGWRMTVLSLLFAILSGGVFGAAMLGSKRMTKGSYMPFGPFLAGGILAALWFGRPVMQLLFLI